MDRITQEAYYRQRVLKYAAKHGVTKAAERYRLSRKTVHKWKRRYDGTIESLKNRSRAPLHSPLKQSDWEIQLVQRYAKKYPRDLLLGYEKAQKRGYVRSYGCFKRTASKLRPPEKKKRTRQNKPYERAAYPGQKIQVDVKFVPSASTGRTSCGFTGTCGCTAWRTAGGSWRYTSGSPTTTS